MSKDENQKPVAPSIPEITGIRNAIVEVEKALSTYETAVREGMDNENRLKTFREEVNKRVANDKTFAMFVTPEVLAKKEAELTEAGRKAVKSSHDLVIMQTNTLNQLSTQLNAKYGFTPAVVHKAKGGSNAGTVTDNVRDALSTELMNRGYSNVSFSEIQPGHYQVTGTDQNGKIRTGRYFNQIMEQW